MTGGERTVVVTGASAGIGRELARLYADERTTLVLTARREERLRELADELHETDGARSVVVPLDLAAADGAQRLLAKLDEAGLRTDVLINNAGFGAFGRFTDHDPERLTKMVSLNVTALTELTRRIVPGMVERGSGRILNVASVASFVPTPFLTVYGATKAYVLSFTHGLAEELRGTGVTVTALCPGPTATEFQEMSGMTAHRPDGVRSMADVGVEQVARDGHGATQDGRRVVVPGLSNRVGVALSRLLPTSWVGRMVRRVNEASMRS